MFRWLKRIVVGLAVMLVLLVGSVYGLSARSLSKSYEHIQGHPLALPADPVEIAEGGRLTRVFACMDCHGEDLGGATMIDQVVMGTIASSNLTAGEGGIGDDYALIDWERAIRHGVRPDGRGLIIMPSADFTEISNADLGRIVAYVRSLPPVDRVLPARRIGPVARGLLAAGVFTLAPEFEHHAKSIVEGPERAATLEFGRYMTRVCVGCHGEGLGGGPAVEPGTPPAANLTPHPTDGLGAWSFDDFDRALRRGVRPDGRELDPMMPWTSFAYFDDLEVQAIWAYLQTVEPVASAPKN